VGIPEKGPEFLPTPDPACKNNSIPRPLGQALGQRGGIGGLTCGRLFPIISGPIYGLPV
jgi:hypothetical protein